MKNFTLLVKPVSFRCNLRCAYCFYNDKSDVFPDGTSRMSFENLESFIKRYQALPFEPRQYIYAWQGGEPTLAGLDFYQHAVFLQKKYGFGVACVSNGLQTNGVLLDDDWAQFLKEYNFLTGISLDGPAEVHDFYRKDSVMQPTHASVMRGIEAMQRNNAEFNILCLVSKANVGRAREVYSFYRTHGFNWLQFIPCVERKSDGTRYEFSLEGEDWGDFLIELFEAWYPDRYTVSIRYFDALMAYFAYGEPIICHMGNDCRQYFCVEHNGDVFPCDFFVRNEYRLGNALRTDWTAMLGSDVYRMFGTQKSLLPGRCKHCKHQIICRGDCLKHRLLPPGNCAEQLSVLCPGWKKFFDKTVPRFEKLGREVRERQQGGF